LNNQTVKLYVPEGTKNPTSEEKINHKMINSLSSMYSDIVVTNQTELSDLLNINDDKDFEEWVNSRHLGCSEKYKHMDAIRTN
jgi:hypothetical protein